MMRTIFLCAVLLALGFVPAMAQQPSYTLDPAGKAVIGLDNLDDSEGCVYSEDTGIVDRREVSGKVLQGIWFVGSYGDEYINVNDPKTIRSKKTRAWVRTGLDQLLAKGNRVHIGVNGCGAAGRVQHLMRVRTAAEALSQKEPNSAVGTITGTLSYPSDHIPPEIQICAESLADGTIACTDKHLKSAGDAGPTTYALDLKPGTYHIYSIMPDGPYRAYYSQYITCGSQAGCPSHEPIAVELQAGQTVENIDPNDWYAPD